MGEVELLDVDPRWTHDCRPRQRVGIGDLDGGTRRGLDRDPVPLREGDERDVHVNAQLAERFALIASEYGTNALWHSGSGAPGGQIRVDLTLAADQVRLRVQDDGPPTVPNDWAPDCLGDHGRGLTLVSEYADEYGHLDTPEGHVAWAVIHR